MSSGSNLTAEQQKRAARIKEQVLPAVEKEVEAMATLLASRSPGEFFGATEFDLRDICHRIGGAMLQTALDERKKGGTEVRA